MCCNHISIAFLRSYIRAQELCEGGGGRPGLHATNCPYGLCGRKATLNMNTAFSPQSPGAVGKSRWPSWVPDCLYGFCGHKATLNIELELA